MYIRSWLAKIFRVSYLQSSSFNVSRATCTKVSPIFLKKFDFLMALDGSTSTMVIVANQWASTHFFLAACLFVKNACT